MIYLSQHDGTCSFFFARQCFTGVLKLRQSTTAVWFFFSFCMCTNFEFCSTLRKIFLLSAHLAESNLVLFLLCGQLLEWIFLALCSSVTTGRLGAKNKTKSNPIKEKKGCFKTGLIAVLRGWRLSGMWSSWSNITPVSFIPSFISITFKKHKLHSYSVCVRMRYMSQLIHLLKRKYQLTDVRISLCQHVCVGRSGTTCTMSLCLSKS